MRKHGLKVCVVGAGIAGLTAAHELAERGFAVSVVDKKRDPRFPGRPVLGGVAASQFRRAHPPLADGRFDESDVPFKTLRARGPLSFNDFRYDDAIEESHLGGEPFYAFDWPVFVYTGEQEWTAPAATSSGDPEAHREAVASAAWAAAVSGDPLPAGPSAEQLALAEASREGRDRMALELARTVEGSETEEAFYVVVTYKGAKEYDLAAARAQHEAFRLASALGHAEAEVVARYTPPGPDSTFAHGPDGNDNVGPSSLVCSMRLPTDNGRNHFILAAVVRLNTTSPAYQIGCNYLQIRLAQQLLPGEHGYRFFPSFYRNLFDTMDRIPLIELVPKDPFRFHTEVALQQHLPPEERSRVSRTAARATRTTVRDNLASVQLHAVATQDGTPPAVLPRSSSMSATLLMKVFDSMQRENMDLPARDLVRSQLRLLKFMTSCQRRREDLADLSFLDYVTEEDTSAAFRDAIRKWPQALAGLRAGEANARTYAAVMVQLTLDEMRLESFRDGTLTGPTTLAWFDHWHDYLVGFHEVDFRVGELAAVDLTDDGLAVRWVPAHGGQGDDPVPLTPPGGGEYDYFVFAVDLAAWFSVGGNWRDEARRTLRSESPLDFVTTLAAGYAQEDGAASEQAYLQGLAQGSAPTPGWVDALKAHAQETVAPAAGQGASPEDQLAVAANHVETRLGLGQGEPVELPFRQYAGIQFFLARDYHFFRGHMYYPNSRWALSSVSQMQFRQTAPERTTTYGGVLSVILGAWDVPGMVVEKPAWLCTPDEIAREVWAQIKAGLEGAAVLPEDPLYFHIDENIELAMDGQPPHGVRRNATPFLVNDARLSGKWPEQAGNYAVHWRRAVFCGTWLDTFTRIVTMESANESARHAVNALLENVRSTKQRVAVGHDCATFDLELDELADLAPLRALDQELHTRGLPHFMEILKVEDAILPMYAHARDHTGPKDSDTVLEALQKYVRTQGELGSVLGAYLLSVLGG